MRGCDGTALAGWYGLAATENLEQLLFFLFCLFLLAPAVWLKRSPEACKPPCMFACVFVALWESSLGFKRLSRGFYPPRKKKTKNRGATRGIVKIKFIHILFWDFVPLNTAICSLCTLWGHTRSIWEHIFFWFGLLANSPTGQTQFVQNSPKIPTRDKQFWIFFFAVYQYWGSESAAHGKNMRGQLHHPAANQKLENWIPASLKLWIPHLEFARFLKNLNSTLKGRPLVAYSEENFQGLLSRFSFVQFFSPIMVPPNFCFLFDFEDCCFFMVHKCWRHRPNLPFPICFSHTFRFFRILIWYFILRIVGWFTTPAQSFLPPKYRGSGRRTHSFAWSPPRKKYRGEKQQKRGWKRPYGLWLNSVGARRRAATRPSR